MAELLHRLGSFAARRAWTVIIAWVVILGIVLAGFLVGFKGLSSSFDIPGTASGDVIAELQDELPDFAGASGAVVFRTDDGSALTDEQRHEISDLVSSADGLPDVARVVDPFASQQELDDQRQQVVDGRVQLDQARAQAESGQQQLDDGLAQLAAGQQQLDEGRARIEAAPLPDAQKQTQLAALDAQQQQIDQQRSVLEQQQAQLTEGLAQIDAQQTQLDDGAELLGFADAIRLVSEDGSTAIVNVSFDKPRLELTEASKEGVVEHFSDPVAGVEVAFNTEISQGVPEIFGVGEVVGVAVAGIVLVVVLGSLLAASFPIVTAIIGVAIGAMATLSFSGLIQMASVTPFLGVMLGLAVGIDYALFILYRHRRQLLAGADVRESIGLANGTAGNAVVFAGSTVIVALLALNITGIPFLGLMGTAGAVSVLVAVLIAVSLTPALLGLAGMRILSRRARARAASAADGAEHPRRAARTAPVDADEHPRRAARTETGPVATTGRPARPMSTLRAVVTMIVATAALLVVAIPALSMRLGLPDGGSEAADSTGYKAFTWSEEAFGAGSNAPLLVTAALPDGTAEGDVQGLQLDVARELFAQDDVVAVAPVAVSDDRTIAAFQVIPAEGPNAVSTDQLVRDLRALPPVDGVMALGVAGAAAINIDISEGLADVLPIYLVVVVGLSFLIMVMVFRSLLVPLIATLGFVLSLFATYGAVTAVFQWGWLGGVFGVHNPGPILSFLPVILVGILFGLAMDYQLFLTTGMREAWAHGAAPRLAVAQGFRAGRTVVIAAAVIMISVFSGFITSEAVIIKSFGLGLALGVLFDAFVVRMLLMPALMHLLGGSAWWLPRWLERIVPNVDVEGSALERRHPGHHGV
ncbi:putative drug exporter of the RND superfamily [Microbacterium sp. ru370.1]|uniref:MMPL family transporter n=1 Tax=unclassified Microbacterium TaxID=2609290 RepID=UPI000880D908|nr:MULTISPECIES: MMPL family transporter [unclassified Microbacterium]SDO46545.1 putative drug exporter of the RND superfamily [Microbacterium sp. ru370.1]SIT81788.1 putative drug exporter of the RND superfamily [Microbacterium sp. RU1D]